MPDINYLLHREQISLLNARNAGSPEARASHAGLARLYARALDNSAFTQSTFTIVARG